MPADIFVSTIRPVSAGDADLFIDFFGSFDERNLYLFTPHAIDPDALRQIVAETPGNPKCARWLLSCEDQGQEVMIGYVFLWDIDTGVPWLGIGLRQTCLERGLGTRMMAHAVEHARSQGKGGIMLTVKKENARAMALYRKFGFEVIGEDHRGELLMITRF
jgi:RimJ/RimL family protein N-acetyltransferase